MQDEQNVDKNILKSGSVHVYIYRYFHSLSKQNKVKEQQHFHTISSEDESVDW